MRRVPPLLTWIPRASRKLRAPTHLAKVAKTLERVARGESIEIAFSVPPRHGKTTLIVHWLVWLLLQRPDLRILYCMHGAKMAEKQTAAMRTIARRVGLELGEIQTKREWTTAAGGSVKACGIKAPPMGDGFDVIVVDDPYASRRSAESPVERANIETAYRDDIMTRELPSGTSHVLVHTRWHVDDLIGVMTRPVEDEDGEAEAEPFELFNFPAIDNDGRALAPWLWSIEQLKRKRARRTPESWASLFQGLPVPRGGAFMVGPVWVDEAPDEVIHAGGVDLARTATTRSDPFASIIFAREPDSDIVYIVDIEHEREPLTDREDPETGETEEGFNRRVHRQQQAYGECGLRMYTGRDESSILDLYAQHKEFPARVDAIVARAPKLERSENFIAAWNAGRVRIVRGIKNALALTAQAKTFTGKKGDADDLIDAATAGYDEIIETLDYKPRDTSKKDPRRGGSRRAAATWASAGRPRSART